MTRSDAKQRPDTPPRPRLWVDGQQRPRFNLAAFGRVAWVMACRALAPELRDASQRLVPVGHAVAMGQLRLTPRRFAGQDARLGRSILGLAALFRGAHDLLTPARPDPTLAYPDIIRSQMPAPPPAQSRADEPTLQAIRSAMFFGPADTPPPVAPPDRATGNNPLRSALWALACRAVLAVLLAFALPLAALRAGWFHLQGGDLADWS